MRVRTITASLMLVAFAVVSGAGTATARPVDDDTGGSPSDRGTGSSRSGDRSSGLGEESPSGSGSGSSGSGHGSSGSDSASPTRPGSSPGRDDNRRPSIKVLVKGAVRPGQTVSINTYCVSEPSTLSVSGPFRLDSGTPGWGSFTTTGRVDRDAADGSVRVNLICGKTTASDSFRVRRFGVPTG